MNMHAIFAIADACAERSLGIDAAELPNLQQLPHDAKFGTPPAASRFLGTPLLRERFGIDDAAHTLAQAP